MAADRFAQAARMGAMPRRYFIQCAAETIRRRQAFGDRICKHRDGGGCESKRGFGEVLIEFKRTPKAGNRRLRVALFSECIAEVAVGRCVIGF
jgi:hypothetical protein